MQAATLCFQLRAQLIKRMQQWLAARNDNRFAGIGIHLLRNPGYREAREISGIPCFFGVAPRAGITAARKPHKYRRHAGVAALALQGIEYFYNGKQDS